VKVWNLEKVLRTSTLAKSPSLAFHFKNAYELGALSLATKENILNVINSAKPLTSLQARFRNLLTLNSSGDFFVAILKILLFILPKLIKQRGEKLPEV